MLEGEGRFMLEGRVHLGGWTAKESLQILDVVVVSLGM